MTGLALFLREAITHPNTVGALFPSSKKLANALAQQIPPNSPGLIIELDAGTGAITAALLHQKKPEHQLIAIERSAKLAKYLADRFPGLSIIQGDAAHLHQLLSKHASSPVQAIVSSLPLRSLPSDTIKKIGQEVNQILKKGGIFIQYTYSLWGKTLTPSSNLKLIHNQWVWQNLPPARIDVFCGQ
ncbi:class I SAM-dependent methyltransferase [Rickettsiella endosymbiont of Dermanyssus gallinae]|uniref:class I SAM-dependent methyltransferase n=1 Tax=Rickettsiella endosymbiont of Dermanyssus gallinae TaxID=2856608 RepID=UPI001C5327AD|nr:methyltransferase domain-containing protein [Rickettsiella endosymbiont of Dermanyssus gallinae]